jgi:hypothetical protein
MPLEWPREGSLALKIGRAVAAGVEAKNADITMKLNADRFRDLFFALAISRRGVDGQRPHRCAHAVGPRRPDLDPDARTRWRHRADEKIPRRLHESSVLLPAASFRPSCTVVGGRARCSARSDLAKLKLDGTAGAFAPICWWRPEWGMLASPLPI